MFCCLMFIRDEISIIISCTVIFSLYLYFSTFFLNWPFLSCILLILTGLVFIFILLARIIFYHTKSKVTWENFQIRFYLTLQFIAAKKQVTSLPWLISNISFIPVQWPRRYVGNSSMQSSDLFSTLYTDYIIYK